MVKNDSSTVAARSASKNGVWQNGPTAYALALALTVLALVIRLALSPWIGERPMLVIFLIPITISAFVGGLGPGLLSTALALIGAQIWLLGPLREMSESYFLDQIFLLVSGSLACLLTEALRRARVRANLNEALYATTLASIGDAVITTDERGKITFLNSEAERLTGWTNADAQGKPLPEVFKIINEETRATVEDPAEKVFRTGLVVGLANHTLLVARDGRETVIDDSGAPIQRADGTIIGVVVVFRDNSEKKKAELAIRQSEALYHSLVDQMPAGIFRKDLAGRYVFVNESFCRLKGCQPLDFLGKTALQLESNDLELLRTGENHHEQIIQTGRTISAHETLLRPDGKILFLEAVKSPVFDRDGKIIGSQGILFDITERRRAETEALESQAIYRSLVSQMPVGIFRKDAEGRYVFVNDYFCQLRGVKPEAFLGKYPAELGSAEDTFKAQATAHHQQIMQSGQAIEVVDEYRRADGSLLYFQVLKSPVFDGHGKVVGSQGIVFDVTGRKQEELAQARLAAIVESSSDAIIGKNLDGIIMSWNRGAELIFGYRAQEAIGKPLLVIFPPDRVEEEKGILERIRKGETVKYFETIRMHKDGRLINISATISPIRDRSGKIIGASKIARDITEQKLVEEKFVREQTRFKLIFDAIPIGIAFHTAQPNGQFTRTINEAHLRLCGLTRAQHDEPGIYKRITHPDDWAAQQIFNAQVQAGAIKQFSIEKRYLHADGKIVWVNFSYQREIYPDGTVDELTTVVDITERRRLEEQLRQSQKMEAIGQLSGGIAHDFNNILTAILGNATLLADPQADRQEVVESAQEIVRATRRAADLTRQLLLFSRKQAIQPVVVDLNNIVSQSIKMLGRILGEDIILHSEYAPNLPMILADVSMMEQVILNLAVNARDAMPNGGRLAIATSMALMKSPEAVDGTEARPHVCLTVNDNGQGIAPEILPRIFEPFFTTKAVGKGTGLGLATVYGIIQQHNGWITINSQPGHGSSFQIYLPAFSGNATTAPATMQRAELPRGNGTILVVEDEPPVRNFVCQLLRRLGYTIWEAENGVVALELWEQHKDTISLVLTDIIMPGGINGQELATHLLKLSPGLKIIFTSGYTGKDIINDNSLVEGSNFLRKPFDPAALAEIVRQKMEKR